MEDIYQDTERQTDTLSVRTGMLRLGGHCVMQGTAVWHRALWCDGWQCCVMEGALKHRVRYNL